MEVFDIHIYYFEWINFFIPKSKMVVHCCFFCLLVSFPPPVYGRTPNTIPQTIQKKNSIYFFSSHHLLAFFLSHDCIWNKWYHQKNKSSEADLLLKNPKKKRSETTAKNPPRTIEFWWSMFGAIFGSEKWMPFVRFEWCPLLLKKLKKWLVEFRNNARPNRFFLAFLKPTKLHTYIHTIWLPVILV